MSLSIYSLASGSIPFFPSPIEVDTTIIALNSILIGFGFVGISLITQSVKSLLSTLSWEVPPIFNFVLPLLEVTQKALRNIILAVRITANITAGHLLIGLLNAFCSVLCWSHTLVVIISFLLVALILIIAIMETVISCIQIYILVILGTYYITQDS
ncbi:MAG: F0F1 ATP synthase subunit A [Desulfobacterales bacterium]|nr:F0F1 ATP synthase subunit A [Desulfobacterales bacterium]